MSIQIKWSGTQLSNIDTKELFLEIEKESEAITEGYVIVKSTIVKMLLEIVPEYEISRILSESCRDYPPLMSYEFCSWVALKLKQSGLTQKEFAFRIGFSQGDLSGVITNRKSKRIGRKKRENLALKILNFETITADKKNI